MRKIKVVCRQNGGDFQEKLYVDGQALDCTFDMETEAAAKFLDAFSPETLTKTCTERYGRDFVLVFRTDDQQMQEFSGFLTEHEADEFHLFIT